MAEVIEKCFPFDATMDENGLPDNVYSAEDFADYFAEFIGDGVYPNPATGLKVNSNSNMTVTVMPGAGWAKGHGYILKEAMDILINTSNANYNRKDIIVLQLSLIDNYLNIKYKAGVAGANPQEPVLTRTDDIWELKLASILVRSGTQMITQADITDTRLDSAVCGIVHGVIDQVDTSEIFSQYDNYWEQKQAEWDSKGDQQEIDWQEQMDAQQAGYESQHDVIQAWYDGARADIATLQTFNFDNMAELPGTNRGTVFNVDGSITETIRKTAGNANVAKRENVFLENGNIQATTTVFDDDGVGILRQSTITTVFHPDGTISEEVVSI